MSAGTWLSVRAWLPAAVADLADLVLPTSCAGCGGGGTRLRYGVCGGCVDAVAHLRPHLTCPDPAPPGLPPCTAVGRYDGVLRELVLAYKERGRHQLARPLGRLLAAAVAGAVQGTGAVRAVRGGGAVGGAPVALVPVPDTAAAARARHGDHLWRLARPAVARLRAAGVPVVLIRPLRALPRPDSVALDTAARSAAARSAFVLRSGGLAALRRRAPGAQVVLLDDVVTTGATLAAIADRLAVAGVPVAAAAVLAATSRKSPANGGWRGAVPWG